MNSPRPAPWLAALLIAGIALLAYANTFSVPFIFDDHDAIVANPTIRQLGTALFPPAGASSAAGRPVPNLTFAFNYALGGTRVAGYHVVNLLIHLAAGLALFGLVRRTLGLPGLAARWASAADPVALVTALLWTVHPLLTESVTYIAPRTESLVGLWYLLMFYALARATGPGASRGWLAAGWLACLLGMLTKEVMAAAPVLALLYYVAFVDGAWRPTLARRGQYLALLALTWLPLALLVGQNRTRGGSAGFGLGVAWWEYALTQCEAVVHYLKLAFWPHPLVLDYGTTVVHHPGAIWPQALLLAALLTATIVGWWRKIPAAFAGAWFFLILAPSSSIVPVVTQTIAERRMYLPLAAVIVLVVAGVQRLAGRGGLLALGVAALALAGLTFQRNADYGTALSIWRDTVAKRPDNPRAQTNLGNLLDDAGQWEEALRCYRTALQLQPDYALAHYNLGNLLLRHGRIDEVIAEYREAIRLDPRAADPHLNLGNIFALQERWPEAQAEFEAGLRIKPTDALAHNNLGNALFNQGHAAEAAAEFARALPELDNPSLHANFATALANSGRPREALEQLQIAARQDPTRADVPYGRGVLLLNEGRRDEGVAQLREALRLKPDYPEARELLARLGFAPP